MIRWLIDRWHARQRAIDLETLWPACKEHVNNLDAAKAAFALHVFHDRAWTCLGQKEIIRRIDELT